jgi:hypothetical protein
MMLGFFGTSILLKTLSYSCLILSLIYAIEVILSFAILIGLSCSAVEKNVPNAKDKPINIAKDKITSIAYINDKIRQEYDRVFSKIEVPKKPSIIT